MIALVPWFCQAKEAEFVVIKCEPPEGCLGMETDFFVDGAPVICLWGCKWQHTPSFQSLGSFK